MRAWETTLKCRKFLAHVWLQTPERCLRSETGRELLACLFPGAYSPIVLSVERWALSVGRSFNTWVCSRFLSAHCAFPCICPGGANTRSENPHEFIGLLECLLQLCSIGQQRDALNQPQPAPRLAEFLVTDAQFVDEIAPRFGAFRLAVVRENRGARSKQLTRDVIARRSTGQSFHESYDQGGILQQPLLKAIPMV